MSYHYDNYGIAYETWYRVSRIVGTMTPQECMEAWGEMRLGFMTPEVDHFQTSPDADYLEKMGEDADLPGFYCRLSASGYLDCTEWSGPFDTMEEAMADLITTYLAWDYVIATVPAQTDTGND